MAYMSIDNLYKDQTILMCKEVFAMEKINGTSSHISFHNNNVTFFSGGASYDTFVKLFDKEFLLAKFGELGIPADKVVIIYGEAYGGKLLGMSKTYGDKLKFIAFEVCIGGVWLNVPKAEEFVKIFGLEFVDYHRILTNIKAIDTERDLPSTQALRNGCGEHIREGIVLRPIEEITLNNGQRVIAKHKRDEFRETASPRSVISPEKLQVIADAKKIAEEWVTMERLNHILTKGVVEAKIENLGTIIKLMMDDIKKESVGETVLSKDAEKQIGRSTALLFKQHYAH